MEVCSRNYTSEKQGNHAGILTFRGRGCLQQQPARILAPWIPEIHQCQLQWATCLDSLQLFPDSFSKAMAISATRCSPWYSMVEAECSLNQPSHSSTFPTFRPRRQCYGYGLPRWSPPTPKASMHQTRHCLSSASRRFAPVMQRTMLGHGQILTMKNDQVSIPNMSKLEMCWSWSVETSIFFLQGFPTYFDCWFFLLPSYTSQCLRRSLMCDPEKLDGVFCIDSNEIIGKYTIFFCTYFVLTYVDFFIITTKPR